MISVHEPTYKRVVIASTREAVSLAQMNHAERVIVGGVIIKDRYDNRNLGRVARYETAPSLFRGAKAIADYLNGYLVGGKPLSRAAVYRMIEDGKMPVTRLGKKHSEVWAKKADLDAFFGITGQ